MTPWKKSSAVSETQSSKKPTRMETYLQGLKKRGTWVLLFAQLFIIMHQLATLNSDKRFVCKLSSWSQTIVCTTVD